MSRRTAIRFAGAALAVSAASAGATGTPPARTARTPTTGAAALPGGGVSVKSFGAMGNSDARGLSGSDDTAAIQAALDYLRSTGGGTLHFPEGYYKISSYLTLCANLVMRGAGRMASTIVATMVGGGGASRGEDIRNGTALYSDWPSNSCTWANIVIEHLGIICANGSNAGAAFFDNCGTGIKIRDCRFWHFKYGVIFDQTELADVYDCDISPADLGGAGVWFVNGETLRSGNIATFTNRISVKSCQLNAGGSVTLVDDDGSYNHSFIDNNYNGGLHHFDFSGTQNFVIMGGEFEGSAREVIRLGESANGSVVGAMLPAVAGGSGSPVLSTGGACSFHGVEFVGATVPVSGARDGAWAFHGCKDPACGAYTDSQNCALFISGQALTPKTYAWGSITFNPSHRGSHIVATNAAGTTATIPNDGTCMFVIGTTIAIEQGASGPVAVTADSGVTLIGIAATTTEYDVLTLRKVAPNTWRSKLT